jgi:hypothetical protein
MKKLMVGTVAFLLFQGTSQAIEIGENVLRSDKKYQTAEVTALQYLGDMDGDAMFSVGYIQSCNQEFVDFHIENIANEMGTRSDEYLASVILKEGATPGCTAADEAGSKIVVLPAQFKTFKIYAYKKN